MIARLGWSDLDELREAVENFDDSVSMIRRLHDLKSQGYVISRTIPVDRRRPRRTNTGSVPSLEYAVTGECRVPFGLTANEVSEALLGIHRDTMAEEAMKDELTNRGDCE